MYQKTDPLFENDNVFEISGLFHKNYRGQKILSKIKKSIIPQLIEQIRLHNLNIRALVIETQPSNIIINKLATEMSFTAQGSCQRDVKFLGVIIGSIDVNRY